MKEPIVKSNYTLEDYNEQVVKVTARFTAAKIYEDLTRENILADMLHYGYKPPTRWQKFKYRVGNIVQRVKDVWTIVSGGDVHRDCGQ